MIDYISSLPPADAAPTWPRTITVLGSTGSIGTSALEFARLNRERFEIFGLAAGSRADLLARQAAELRPRVLALADATRLEELRSLLPSGYAPDILTGEDASARLAGMTDADMVLSAIVGAAGLASTHAAVRAGRMVALANKESLVLAGGLLRALCRETGSVILPVDSEHNALFQCLGHEHDAVTRLVLTASGGPFRGRDRAFLEAVTREQALNHPNWSMGAKISIDSATLMNKGLEVIEACHLYGITPEKVEVVVHPQSIIHSAVEFRDSSLLAHLGPPDMRVAIGYCLGYPERMATGVQPLDLTSLSGLTFDRPDTECFPCLRLARDAFAAGPSHTVVLNAANEVAVQAFLDGRIGFTDIPVLVARELDAHAGEDLPGLEAILDLDRRVRTRLANGNPQPPDGT